MRAGRLQKHLARRPERRQKRRKGERRENTHRGSKGRSALAFCFSKVMLIATHFREELRPDGVRLIHNLDWPVCPDCGEALSGYDRRRRTVRDDKGEVSVYLLRRLYCRQCGCLHLELPDTMHPQKHYTAQLIAQTVAGSIDFCPADNSTIRRWRKNHPPVLPPSPSDTEV